MFIRKLDAGVGHVCISQVGYSVIQGSWSLNTSTTFAFMTEVVNGAGPAIGDAITHLVFLAQGTYKVHGVHVSGSNRGQIKLSLSSGAMAPLTIHTADLYSAVSDTGHTESSSTFSVPADGIYVLKFEITGKNASATNYFGGYQKLVLVRQS